MQIFFGFTSIETLLLKIVREWFKQRILKCKHVWRGKGSRKRQEGSPEQI